jgi:hypothetical protein
MKGSFLFSKEHWYQHLDLLPKYSGFTILWIMKVIYTSVFFSAYRYLIPAGKYSYILVKSRGSSVGIGTGCLQDGPNSIPSSFRFFNSRQPSNKCVPGAISQEIKQPGCEADCSRPSSAQIKNGGAILLLYHTSMSSWYIFNQLSTGTTLVYLTYTSRVYNLAHLKYEYIWPQQEK